MFRLHSFVTDSCGVQYSHFQEKQSWFQNKFVTNHPHVGTEMMGNNLTYCLPSNV